MSFYSLDPLKFQEADAQLAEVERRREWALLHGDGQRRKALSKYDKMTHEDFVKHLTLILEGVPASSLLGMPGVFEVLAELFNNEVLESWEQEQITNQESGAA